MLPLPALFIAHGHPMNALEDNSFTASWQQLIAGMQPPEAILCISAHWETPGIYLTADAWPSTVHDFYGFPPELYAARYPCPGEPSLAAAIAASLPEAYLSEGRGLDHGCWCILSKLFPSAGIPVIQMSLDARQPASWHFQVGQQLRPWRERGVLVLASGNIVHNIRRWMSAGDDIEWALAFDQWASQHLDSGQLPSLADYQQAPSWREAVPTPEHYLPLLYAAGCHREGEPIVQTRFPASPTAAGQLANACMRSIRFGEV